MSNQLPPAEKNEFRILLMKAVDREITSDEEKKFKKYIQKYEACNKEWREFKNLKEVTQQMRFRNPPDEVWDTYWEHVYNRLERGLAWVFVSIGTIILLTYALFQIAESLFRDSQLETIVKVAILLVIAGLVMLLVSVVREKMVLFKKDPYKEIKR